MYINMENIFENLEVSEDCFEEILIKVFEAIDSSVENKVKRVDNLTKAMKYAQGAKKTRIAKILGRAQSAVNKAQAKNKEDVKNSGITFTSKAFS